MSKGGAGAAFAPPLATPLDVCVCVYTYKQGYMYVQCVHVKELCYMYDSIIIAPPSHNQPLILGYGMMTPKSLETQKFFVNT